MRHIQSKSGGPMKSRILSVVLILLFITACNGTFDVGIEHPSNSTATLAPAVTDTLASSTPVLPTVTLSAVTATLIPSNTPAPAATNTAAPATLAPRNTSAPLATNTTVPNPTTATYIDDRSTPSQVVVSLYSAINRQEYSRAYNYWINPSTSLGNFATYANGYKDTTSVNLVFGQITGGAGAEHIYYTVPVILETTEKNGSHANYAACY